MHAASSVLPHGPNIIAPRQSALTSTPVEPSFRYSIYRRMNGGCAIACPATIVMT